jgi:anti-sigma B factor antagonist
MPRVTIEQTAGVAMIVARGDLDAYDAPELSAAFTELAQDRSVVVDLGAVSFIDSTALGVVVRSVREIEERGDDSRVVLPRGTARRIFEITTLDRVLPVAESRVKAVEALTGTV